LRRSAGARATLLNAVEISGRKAAPGTDLNEHVWYDFPTVARLAARLTHVLLRKDPADTAILRANAARFAGRLRALEASEARIRTASAGRGVLVTEPVPLYLLQACGLVNRTPPAFSRAVEDGTEVAPRVLSQALQLVAAPGIALIAFNEQESGRDTDQLLAAARRHGVGVVPVTETLPAGRDYLSWMAANLSAVASALDRV
jgi:zinc/manganese transport system substrate-binding protein